MASQLPAYSEHLLPDPTPLEAVFAAVAENRIATIPVPLKLLSDPYQCPSQFLDHLAFEVGVDIWDETWPESKKRSVIAKTILVKQRLGTRGGIEAYINIEDASLVDVVTPPQTPFVSKALSDADYATWLGQLPQLRIYWGNDQGTTQPGQVFIGSNAFVGSAPLTHDNARWLQGRRAYYYDPATDTETRITLGDIGVTTETVTEQVMVPGKAGANVAFANRAFVGASFIGDPNDDLPTTVTYTLSKDVSNQAALGSLVLTLAQCFNPVNTRYDRVSVQGKRNATQTFIGNGFVGSGFVATSDATTDFYDRLYLADPSVAAPVTKGTTYIGHSRLQMEPYRAEMLIDAKESIAPMIAMEGRFVGNCFVQAQDDTKRDRILKAIELSKSGRDRVFVDFQVTEVVSLADTPALDGSTSLGQRLPRYRL